MNFASKLVVAIIAAAAFTNANAQDGTFIHQASVSSLRATTATIAANLSGSGITIPAGFVGYSFNTTGLISGTITGSDVSLVSILGLLGTSGTVRVGGNDADTATPPALTQPIANAFASLVTGLGSGWTAMYDLDAVANDSATATTQAGYLVTAFGASKITLQVGNEPIGSGHFTVSSYETVFNSYYAAVIASIPTAKFGTFEDGKFGNTQTIVNGITPGASGLKMITQHYYPTVTDAAPALWASSMLGYLQISISPSAPFENVLQNDIWAASNSIPLFMSESNSHGGGGVVGLSDRMMGATFFLNEAIILASAGWAGLDFHNNFNYNVCPSNPGSSCGIYNSIAKDANNLWVAQPVFYGLYLFSKIEGQQIVPASVTGNANVQVITTKGGNGNANIVVVNNDPYGAATIIPKQSSAWTTATVLQMQGTAGCTEPNPTIGGAIIGESGSWSGSTFSISNGQSVRLGPCEAALISIQP